MAHEAKLKKFHQIVLTNFRCSFLLILFYHSGESTDVFFIFLPSHFLTQQVLDLHGEIKTHKHSLSTQNVQTYLAIFIILTFTEPINKVFFFRYVMQINSIL